MAAAKEDWQDDLRMPLLQLGLAHVTGRPVAEIVVGYQDLDGTGLETTAYSTSEIEDAKRCLLALAKRLMALQRP